MKIIENIYKQVGKNYELEKINIISPYFSETFFLSEFKNCEISLVTDISCPKDSKNNIKEKVNSIKFYKSDKGMLHAKCYLFHFKSNNGIKYVLLWGSANATEAGFTNNAEIYSWLEFTDKSEDYKELIEYFKQIDDCTVPTNGKDSQEIKGITLELQEGKVILPSLIFVDYKYLTFDLWVQRGYLHIEESTPLQFKISLELKKKIDSSKTEKIFKSSGTLKRGEPKSIILDYSEDYFKRLNVNIEKLWKSKFLNKTMFGRWCSKECKKHILELKHNELDNYKQEYKDNKEKEIEALISKLKDVVYDLGESATDYFEFKNSEIDIEYYEKEFCKNLEKNFNDAKKSIPKFISASFLHSSPLLKQVVNTLIESIIHPTTGNKLASYIKSKHLDNDDLVKSLRDNWKNLNPEIIRYYEYESNKSKDEPSPQREFEF